MDCATDTPVLCNAVSDVSIAFIVNTGFALDGFVAMQGSVVHSARVFRSQCGGSPSRIELPSDRGTFLRRRCLFVKHLTEEHMGFGRGLLLWLLGIPLPIIILLALFWHH